MNSDRRDKLRIAADMMEACYKLVDQVHDEESDCMDNIPENLQSSEMYMKIEDNVYNLGDVLDILESAMSVLEAVV